MVSGASIRGRAAPDARRDLPRERRPPCLDYGQPRLTGTTRGTFFHRVAIRAAMPGRLSFDRVAAIYDETRSLAPRAMARVLAVLVDQLQGRRGLEVGVGTGRDAVPLQKSGVRAVGVDISRKMIEFGLAKGLRDVVFADAARLPFVSGAFDVATTNHVLHLIPDWRDRLTEIARATPAVDFTVIEH